MLIFPSVLFNVFAFSWEIYIIQIEIILSVPSDENGLYYAYNTIHHDDFKEFRNVERISILYKKRYVTNYRCYKNKQAIKPTEH